MIKLLLRIYPLSDLEIIVGDYLIEKAKLDDMSKEEEHMSSEFNVMVLNRLINNNLNRH